MSDLHKSKTIMMLKITNWWARKEGQLLSKALVQANSWLAVTGNTTALPGKLPAKWHLLNTFQRTPSWPLQVETHLLPSPTRFPRLPPAVSWNFALSSPISVRHRSCTPWIVLRLTSILGLFDALPFLAPVALTSCKLMMVLHICSMFGPNSGMWGMRSISDRPIHAADLEDLEVASSITEIGKLLNLSAKAGPIERKSSKSKLLENFEFKFELFDGHSRRHTFVCSKWSSGKKKFRMFTFKGKLWAFDRALEHLALNSNFELSS